MREMGRGGRNLSQEHKETKNLNSQIKPMNVSQNSSPVSRPGRGFLALVLLLSAIWWAVPAQAQTVTNTIYQDQFSGSGALNGRTPDTAGSNQWVAAVNWTVGSGVATATAASGGADAYLSFVPVAGNVYTLSAFLIHPERDLSANARLLHNAASKRGLSLFCRPGTDTERNGWRLRKPEVVRAPSMVVYITDSGMRTVNTTNGNLCIAPTNEQKYGAWILDDPSQDADSPAPPMATPSRWMIRIGAASFHATGTSRVTTAAMVLRRHTLVETNVRLLISRFRVPGRLDFALI
jgi:hypothetical protein